MSKGEARAAMAISWALEKVVWRLMDEGKAVAEAEINSLVTGNLTSPGSSCYCFQGQRFQECWVPKEAPRGSKLVETRSSARKKPVAYRVVHSEKRRIFLSSPLPQILTVDRDFKDTVLAHFTVRQAAVRNMVPGAKNPIMVSAWNPPADWGRCAQLSNTPRVLPATEPKAVRV